MSGTPRSVSKVQSLRLQDRNLAFYVRLRRQNVIRSVPNALDVQIVMCPVSMLGVARRDEESKQVFNGHLLQLVGTLLAH